MTNKLFVSILFFILRSTLPSIETFIRCHSLW